MIRGTTPTHIFTLPIEAELIKCAQVIYTQDGGAKLTKDINDCALDGKTLTVRLSQEDTLFFACDRCVRIQVRVLTQAGDALASHVMRVRCEECLSDEVLA